MQPAPGKLQNKASDRGVHTPETPGCAFRQVSWLCAPGSGQVGLAGMSLSCPQFSGLWHVVSMVSDCKVFLGKKDHLLMSTRAVQATAEGGLSVHMEFPW